MKAKYKNNEIIQCLNNRSHISAVWEQKLHENQENVTILLIIA